MKQKKELCSRQGVAVEPHRCSDLLDLNGRPILGYSIEYPQIAHPDLFTECYLNGYYTYCAAKQEEAFIKKLFPALVKRTEGKGFQPSIARSRFRVTYNKNGLFSTVLEYNLYSAQGEVQAAEQSAITWDLDRGRSLPLRAMFRTRSSYRRRILAAAMGLIERNHLERELSLPEDWRESLKDNLFQENFYLTETGVCVFYPTGMLAGPEQGVVNLLIPLTALQSQLRRKL
ncbi:MAG TPA: hypothetical protein IAB57_05570 [Candidatus Fimivivens faecavium]|nr:hypothetical protein [Candidatus Fimivivens faecavium]